MDVNFFKKLGWSIVLILLQVFVLNHVHLFGIATPLLYIYFIVQFRRNYPQWGMMLWAFVMGLFIDMFSNTPGVSSFSLTALGLANIYGLSLFLLSFIVSYSSHLICSHFSIYWNGELVSWLVRCLL